MSGPDEKKINHLYALLREKEQSDPNMAASLRWAIFNLEQQVQNQQQPTDPLSQIKKYAAKPEPEVNSIVDTGIFNEIIKGYLVVAMREATFETGQILSAVEALEDAFEDTDAASARKAYREL